jgi:hypothetical protein
MQTPGNGWWCEEHQRSECTSPRKNGRGQCHGSLVAGSDRCRMHLGKRAPAAIAEAKLNEQAAAELARLDVPAVADPFYELCRLAGQAVAWKDAMAAKVNELTELRYEDAKGGEQLRSEIALWERALDRCLATLTALARLNIDDRMVGIREKTAAMLEQALDRALAKACRGDIELMAEARVEYRRHLRIVAVPEPEPKAVTTGNGYRSASSP